MIKLMQNIDKAFYQYHRNLDKFYIENSELIDTLDLALKRKYPLFGEMESLQELYDNFNEHIKFVSEYNETIDDYLI